MTELNAASVCCTFTSPLIDYDSPRALAAASVNKYTALCPPLFSYQPPLPSEQQHPSPFPFTTKAITICASDRLQSSTTPILHRAPHIITTGILINHQHGVQYSPQFYQA